MEQAVSAGGAVGAQALEEGHCTAERRRQRGTHCRARSQRRAGWPALQAMALPAVPPLSQPGGSHPASYPARCQHLTARQPPAAPRPAPLQLLRQGIVDVGLVAPSPTEGFFQRCSFGPDPEGAVTQLLSPAGLERWRRPGPWEFAPRPGLETLLLQSL